MYRRNQNQFISSPDSRDGQEKKLYVAYGFSAGKLETWAYSKEEAENEMRKHEYNWACSCGNHPDLGPVELVKK